MLATERVLSNLESESVSRGASRRCVWSPVLLSGDGHTRRRRQHYLLLVPANIWRIWTTFAKRKQSTISVTKSQEICESNRFWSSPGSSPLKMLKFWRIFIEIRAF